MKEFLDKASTAYYEGSPIISDEEFDRLSRACNYRSVGYSVEGGVELPYRLYSLETIFEGESYPIDISSKSTIKSPKLDGLAIALIYVHGNLLSIITRGDCKVGKDVSRHIPSFPVPKSIKTTEEVVQINGELVAPKDIPRARNYASGAVGLKDTKEFATRDLTFVAYGIIPYPTDNFSTDMELLRSRGFKTVLDAEGLNKFPTDGIVYRLNSNKKYLDAGFTAREPKGAFALKTLKTGITTTLKDVVWQVGKSGIVSPVAILEPIEIDGATISRATLHNIKYIDALGLEIGCDVEVIRSGDIIPRIVRRVD
jgi:DNA ligase (NAD+)